MSFSGSTQPSLRGHAHQSPSITIKSLTTASLTASDAAPHRVETLAGELAPESAQNSSSHRAGKGLSPSSRSTQSQTPRAGSSASSSTIAGLQDLRTGPSAPPPMLTGLPHHSIKERYGSYTLCFFQGVSRVDLLSIHVASPLVHIQNIQAHHPPAAAARSSMWAGKQGQAPSGPAPNPSATHTQEGRHRRRRVSTH